MGQKLKKALGTLTPDELKSIIAKYNSGEAIQYDIKHVHGELLFRDMMKQWEEDEVKEKNDGGCGHDQNEDYYRD